MDRRAGGKLMWKQHAFPPSTPLPSPISASDAYEMLCLQFVNHLHYISELHFT